MDIAYLISRAIVRDTSARMTCSAPECWSFRGGRHCLTRPVQESSRGFRSGSLALRQGSQEAHSKLILACIGPNLVYLPELAELAEFLQPNHPVVTNLPRFGISGRKFNPTLCFRHGACRVLLGNISLTSHLGFPFPQFDR